MRPHHKHHTHFSILLKNQLSFDDLYMDQSSTGNLKLHPVKELETRVLLFSATKLPSLCEEVVKL